MSRNCARHSSKSDEHRLALYAQGLSDRLIGEAEGVTKWTIAKWRWLRSLPPNDSPTIRFEYADAAKRALMLERFTLIKRGWTDDTVSHHQHRHRKSIWAFRKRNGLLLATGTLDDKPRIVSYEASFGERHMADPSWSNWLEEMGATVW